MEEGSAGGDGAGESGGAAGSSNPDRKPPPRTSPPSDPDPAPADPEPSDPGAGGASGQPDPSGQTGVGTDAGSPSGPMADAMPEPVDPPASPPPEPVDVCANLAALPVAFTTRTDVPVTDEFTFDGQGNLLAFDGRDVVRINANGGFEPLFRNVLGARGGALRALDTGELMVADYQREEIIRLDPGESRPSRSGNVRRPMKMVRGPADTLFVSSSNGFIYRIDVRTGNQRVVVSGRTEWSGLTFDVGYNTLYAGADDEDAIYTLSLDAAGNLGPPRRWLRVDVPKAMATDACGNIYVVGGNSGTVRRIDAEGRVQTVANVRADDLWSVAFGSGQQGWSETSLYVMDYDDRGLYELQVRVKGNPPPPPATIIP